MPKSNIEILSELRSQFNCFDEKEEPCYRALSEAIQALSEGAERKAGEWIKGIDVPGRNPYLHLSDALYCSVCHNEAYWDTDYGQQIFDYCPNCGADMKGEQE